MDWILQTISARGLWRWMLLPVSQQPLVIDSQKLSIEDDDNPHRQNSMEHSVLHGISGNPFPSNKLSMRGSWGRFHPTPSPHCSPQCHMKFHLRVSQA